MTDMKLKQFKVLCFDVYGTLVDWETGIYDRIAPLGIQAASGWSRQEALAAFASVESDLQAQDPSAPYSKILADTYYTLAKRLNLPEGEKLKEDSVVFGNSIPTWPVFPDTISALARLSQHFRLVVLSNVDKKSFAQTQKILEQGFKFDLVITAEDVGSYKPNPANFEYMLESVKTNLAIGKHEVLVTAQSLFHDHIPASGLGIATCWIARASAVIGIDVDMKRMFEFPTLRAMADSLEAEVRA